ncbi:glycoside hydrolase family 38 C-terminal domain-containing protein [Flavobacterium gilvum]|uniref:Glycosyl hydrolase n=2 Tax=Flavobacterium gilvum TaxID=1492737 RepID=A0AAC9I933_9FLAO|nr:glycoside hydrolase family 38 C-terminal domain-containing protein [Flavobacterium gilvum]AOW10592.1 glycosyl hydrolase [Flavobacterium gilvum]
MVNFYKINKKTLIHLVFILVSTSMFATILPTETVECIVQPVYRFRKDKTPGREIIIKLKEGKLEGKIAVDITAGKTKETTEFLDKKEGYSELSILLPNTIGVNSNETVTIAIHQGKNTIKKTVDVPAMRYWNVYLYNHAHVDIGYTNTHKNVELLHKNNILEGIKLAEKTKTYPKGSQFVWNPEVTWPLERLWETQPEERTNVLNAIKSGFISIDASYLNIDTSVCSDEELFHIFNFSRKIQRLSGKPIDVFQQVDIPGISWGMVPVLNQQGIKYIMSWPNTDRAGFVHEGLDRKPVWWYGPDGKSKVLFFQPGQYANSGSMDKGGATGRPWFGQRDPQKVPLYIQTGDANVDFTKKLTDMETEKYPYDFLVLSWSLWDNNPLDADIPDAVKKWNETHAYPQIIISGGHQIMEMIDKKYGDKLPAVKGDFTEFWTDGQGTEAKYAAMNRKSKEILTQSETLWSMLHPAKSAPRNEFEEAWRKIILGSEHTWCFEDPKDTYFQDAIFKVKKGYFIDAHERSTDLMDEALAPATLQANGKIPSGIAVFNTHSWNHSGIVTLSKAESDLGNKVLDDKGNEVPSQRLSTGELLFMASDVPALGSKHYRIEKGNSSFTKGCVISGTTLENNKIKVVVDGKTGNITQLIDLSSGQNLADAKVNGGLNAFRWLPANVDAPKSDTDISIKITENGPLVAELTVTSKGEGCRSISRSVRLINDVKWVEINNVVDKLPLMEKDGIHFGFGFDVPQSKTRVDIPWGIMEVEKDQWKQANRNWIAMQRWLDVSNNKKGITWCSLDTPLFEYGGMTANIALSWGAKGPWLKKLEPSSTIYSWVMNNHWHTNFPLTQDGPVSFRYRLMPHGEFNPLEANRFGLEQSQPLVHVLTEKDPKTKPLLIIDNEKVIVTILKQGEKEGEMIVRLRSLSDKTETANISFPSISPKSVNVCEIEENAGASVSNSVSILPYGMMTIKVQF